jgi:hypothetical protein
MKIENKNTFIDEKVYIDKEKGLIYIGKNAYSVKSLEKIVQLAKVKDINDSLNYRVRKYADE